MLLTVYRAEFTSWKSLITFKYSPICPLTSIIIIFYKDISCHIFTHFSHKNFSHNVSSVCPRVLVTSDYKNNQSNIQKKLYGYILKHCQEGEKEKKTTQAIKKVFGITRKRKKVNTGNYKVFCVKRQRNKSCYEKSRFIFKLFLLRFNLQLFLIAFQISQFYIQ